VSVGGSLKGQDDGIGAIEQHWRLGRSITTDANSDTENCDQINAFLH
jgi:hypothetical protein